MFTGRIGRVQFILGYITLLSIVAFLGIASAIVASSLQTAREMGRAAAAAQQSPDAVQTVSTTLLP